MYGTTNAKSFDAPAHSSTQAQPQPHLLGFYHGPAALVKQHCRLVLRQHQVQGGEGRLTCWSEGGSEAELG